MPASPPPSAADQRRFDRAVRRFNDRAYFEAHEDWEDLWHEALGSEKRWLQGLIQVAAAFVHFERGFFDRGFAALMAEGVGRMAGYEGRTWHLDMTHLERVLAPWIRHAARVRAGAAMGEDAPNKRPHLAFAADYEPDPLPER